MAEEAAMKKLNVVLPSQCGRDCSVCIVRQSAEKEWIDCVSRLDRLPNLMEKCRECPGWTKDETVCWGSICPLRICCQNCGLGASFQCRKFPCRQFLNPGAD